MKLQDLAGVFSRQFVVGFFVPSFFGLAIAAVVLSSGFLPDDFEGYGLGTQLVILGALGIPVGLLLQGFQPTLLAALEEERSSLTPFRYVPRRVYDALVWLRLREYDRYLRRRDEPGSDEAELAAWNLDQRYPIDRGDVLATRFGNVLKATQDYVYTRWGLDTYAAWPRIEALLSEQERELIDDTRTELAFFLNSAIACALVGAAVVADEVWHRLLGPDWAALYAAPFGLGYVMYRLSVTAAIRWAAARRACVDLHRLEFFERLGVKPPPTHAGQIELGHVVNRFVLYRWPLPDTALGVERDNTRDAFVRRVWRYFFGD